MADSALARLAEMTEEAWRLELAARGGKGYYPALRATKAKIVEFERVAIAMLAGEIAMDPQVAALVAAWDEQGKARENARTADMSTDEWLAIIEPLIAEDDALVATMSRVQRDLASYVWREREKQQHAGYAGA